METQYLTKEKFDELKQELEDLKTNKRKDVSEKLEYAKKLGDLSENAEYQDARDEQAKIEDRIKHLESLLQVAEILSDGAGEAVSIGSVVILKKEDGNEAKYKIVGSEEADMDQNKISNLSPLGEILIGKKVGQNVEISCPRGKVSYQILGIE
jgi:transcription elongation factor GreA